MSDTPRTEIYVLDRLPEIVPADWARQLERELSAANERIRRLEEAGSELRECAAQFGYTSTDDSRWIARAERAVKTWDKEAKP